MQPRRWLGMLALVAAMLAGCGRPAPSPSPTAALTATALPTATPSPAAPPPRTPTPIPLPSPTRTPAPSPTPSPTPCAAEVCVLSWAFPLRRPIAPPGNSAIAPTYPFGSDYHGLRKPHHGVDMANPYGTPVLAAADGVVVFAGDDIRHPLTPWPNFYGQAVVLEHHLPGVPWPLFTLYGHLETIGVRVGQTIAAGEAVGTVGSRGVATGPHLHFEVRLGENAYQAAQNPVLWMQPAAPDDGALALRLTDPSGHPRHLTAIVLRGLTPGLPTRYPQTYVEEALHGDPRLHENAAVGDLPPGDYELEITCCGRLYRRVVEIRPHHLTLVRWRLP